MNAPRLVLAFGLAGVASCRTAELPAPPLVPGAAEQLADGMTVSEVRALLGEPTWVSHSMHLRSHASAHHDDRELYVYARRGAFAPYASGDAATLSLSFEEGRLDTSASSLVREALMCGPEDLGERELARAIEDGIDARLELPGEDDAMAELVEDVLRGGPDGARAKSGLVRAGTRAVPSLVLALRDLDLEDRDDTRVGYELHGLLLAVSEHVVDPRFRVGPSSPRDVLWNRACVLGWEAFWREHRDPAELTEYLRRARLSELLPRRR